MNQKTIIRLILGVLVAVLGAWQMRHQPAPAPAHAPQQQQGKDRSQPAGQGGQQAGLPGGSQGGSANGRQGGSQRSAQAGDFDYYLISLSWSPSYCVTHPNDRRQCGDRGFGFVLHGLWPQKSSGGWPEDCPASSQPSAAAVARALAFMPSEKLIRHEWSKHGTCTGLSADEYLALADRAFAQIRLPPAFEAPSSTRSIPVDQVLAEFRAANPQFPADSFTVRCSANDLEEVRVCVDTRLQPQSCGKGVRTQCGRDKVQIRSVR